MTYQEKLAEFLRELDNLTPQDLIELTKRSGFDLASPRGLLLAGIEQGLTMALELAEQSKIDGEI